ncbi:MAG: enoyl-CoA hydratase/isomerase family protein [Elusimicrobia bacterium]|nr:enoyl-CoA hydratase/isomerase family protein [Elusimicrobiota bacterium]
MITLEDRDGVRTLSLDRPPSNNLSGAILDRLAQAARDAAAEPSVKAVVLRSSLPKYFSAGLDGNDLVGADGNPRTFAFERLLLMYRAWLELPKPTIAAIDGYALAGGCIVAMTCDFRFISKETGRMALNEVKLGLSPTPLFLSRLLSIGVSPAGVRQLALKGRTLRSEEALAIGLVDRVVPSAELHAEAFAEARALIKLPPMAYGLVKRHLMGSISPHVETRMRDAQAEFPKLIGSPEAKEALGGVASRKQSSEA